MNRSFEHPREARRTRARLAQVPGNALDECAESVDLVVELPELLIDTRPLSDNRPLGSVLFEHRQQVGAARLFDADLELPFMQLDMCQNRPRLCCRQRLGQVESLLECEMHHPVAVDEAVRPEGELVPRAFGDASHAIGVAGQLALPEAHRRLASSVDNGRGRAFDRVVRARALAGAGLGECELPPFIGEVLLALSHGQMKAFEGRKSTRPGFGSIHSTRRFPLRTGSMTFTRWNGSSCDRRSRIAYCLPG